MAARIGVIGGSFDPPHIAHLMMAQDAAEQLNLSRVLFIPALIPPHKQHIQRADAKHRLKMLELATDDHPLFSVSDIEIGREGLSYTVETIEALRKRYSDAEFFLIVGGDTLVELHTWYRVEELLEMCTVATVLRPGAEMMDDLAARLKLPKKYTSMVMKHRIESVLMDISSTEIRRRIASGIGIRYLVPAAVDAYIREHKLYRT